MDHIKWSRSSIIMNKKCILYESLKNILDHCVGYHDPRQLETMKNYF